ncbi:BQ2448_5698 [Microbotryum intermedium]|uniref:BQ2448_5698 protein n=1 Tax=Microbotryum intermedium TaxID=269621 RepID=A0A238EYY3_9BASI|nr:BQ2448_5698 [Microbotryum intermedium]
MTDSWSGLGGQFTTVLPLLFLASMTSRIAIVPSFNDEHHYGADVIVRMSMLYDLERFRQIVSAWPNIVTRLQVRSSSGLGPTFHATIRPGSFLFVEQDDVKIRDPKHTLTQEDDVGCYISNWSFDQGLSYGHHNIHQTIIRLDRPGVAGKDWADWTYESYAMFDMDFERRMEMSREILAKEGITGENLPRNLKTATKTSSLMCYTNLWDL